MRASHLLLLVSLIVLSLGQNCGPSQCYQGCTDSRVPVDLVFIIDVSGSMSEEIAGVRSGLTKFVSDLLSQNLIPWYNVILYGNNNNQAVVALNGETDFARFKTVMDGIKVNGGWEPSLETIRRSCDSATVSNFGLKLRSNSKKILILLTDEDSDPAYNPSNRFQSINDGNENCNPPNWSQWQMEIDATAKSLIDKDFASYFLVSMETTSAFRTKQTCLTKRQFGDFTIQAQTPDYKVFDAKQTLTNLANAGIPDCLQGKLLRAGKTARVFNVFLADDSVLVQNFYQAITWDLSQCNAKCILYPCSSENKCMTPVYICGCDGEPYSNKTLDPLGECCLESEKDCFGLCNGKATLDPCGVCVSEGTTVSPLCEQDCAKRFYLTQKPAPDVFYTSDASQPDPAGYLLSNSDLYTEFASPTGKLRSLVALREQFHQNGRFEGRVTCDFDSERYAKDHGVAKVDAKNSWINSLLSDTPITSKPAAFCLPNTRRRITNYLLDQCSQCVELLDQPPFCMKDCLDVYRTNSNSAYYIDECGKCVAPEIPPNSFKDSCGVCFGNNTAKNQCGECFGSRSLDACGLPVCQNSNCAKNCAGEPETQPFSKVLDECGFCVPRGTRNNLCLRDCGGFFYVQGTIPNFITDECGNCLPSSSDPPRDPRCVQDCSGKWNGTAFYDRCQQCVDGVDDFVCIQDCQGNYYRQGKDEPSVLIDECGECNTIQNQNKLKDRCGVCTNKNGYNSATECTADCKGIYSLPNDPKSILDFCNDCWFPNQTQFINYRVDDCGFCRESRDDPRWNENRLKDSFGVLCVCFQPPNQCEDSRGVYFDSCSDCPPPSNCPLGQTEDECGLCPGDSMYGKKDRCGLCCNPERGQPCDVDVDDCGKCFGFNKDKEKNPCRICNSTLCVVDCLGVPFGSAVINPCDGKCNSTTVCSTCGNGIVEQGETCDLGNGKNVPGSGCVSCQVEASNSEGSKIGGAIGAVASVAFVAVAAFAAYRYAKKNGMIGKSGRKLDLNGSNENPLYESRVSFQSNPMYQ